MPIEERRRQSRIKTSLELRVRIAALDLEWEVVDLSFGGLQVTGPHRLDRADTFVVQISAGDGRALASLAARPVYCHRASPESTDYACGLAFVGLRDPLTRAAIQSVMDAVTPRRETVEATPARPQPNT